MIITDYDGLEYGRICIKEALEEHKPFLCTSCARSTGAHCSDVNELYKIEFPCSRCDEELEFTRPFKEKVQTTEYKIVTKI